MVFPVKRLPSECHKTLLIASQHWLENGFGIVVRQQAITWTNGGPMVAQMYDAKWYHQKLKINSFLELIKICSKPGIIGAHSCWGLIRKVANQSWDSAECYQ